MNPKSQSLNLTFFSWFKWTFAVVLLAYTFYPTFVWMVDRWLARDSYYTHGFIIPVLSVFWIYKRRSALQKCEIRKEPLGFVILLIGAAIQIVSSLLRIYFISAFSFVIVIFGIVLFMFGKEVIRLTWFPIAFLTLMIPLPLLVISEVTLRMKFFVSEIATFLLNSIGVKAYREGSYIYTPHALCLVGDPCSGLRSFLAFLCLGFVFAYGASMAFWKKIILVSAGLPLAIISNVVRVFVMGLLGEIYGMEFVAQKAVHDGGGILAFVVALTCFLLIRQELETTRAR